MPVRGKRKASADCTAAETADAASRHANCAGVAVGRVFILDDVHQRVPRRTIADTQVEHEKARLAGAIDAAKRRLEICRIR